MHTTSSRFVRLSLTFALALGGTSLLGACGGDGHDGHDADHGDGILEAPTDLTATAVTGGVHLTWQDNSSDEDEFMIDRRSEGGAWASVGTAPADTAMFHDADVDAGTTYQYLVRAMSPEGHSAPSNEVTIAVP